MPSRDRARLAGAASWCDHCERAVYVPVHDCPDTPPLQTLMSQIRRHASAEGIALRQAGPMWIASDHDTHESASDHTMVGAWASLRGVEPTVVYRQLRKAGIAPLPTGERDLGRRHDDP